MHVFKYNCKSPNVSLPFITIQSFLGRTYYDTTHRLTHSHTQFKPFDSSGHESWIIEMSVANLAFLSSIRMKACIGGVYAYIQSLYLSSVSTTLIKLTHENVLFHAVTLHYITTQCHWYPEALQMIITHDHVYTKHLLSFCTKYTISW